MREHDESKLPNWAQGVLENLRAKNERLEFELARTQQAHAVLMSRRWFTVPHPGDDDDGLCLFALRSNEAVCVCTLGPGDTLLVGRKMEKVRL